MKNNEKICDKNLSIQKSLGYSYTVFILKESKSFLYWRYWQFVISKLLLLKGSWIKQKTQSTLTNYSGWKWIDSWRLHLCSMNRNMTGKPDGACFWNVLKDVKNTAAYGKDWTEKVMAVPPYNQETCYPLSSFQAPHQPWYGQPMFNPVQLCYGGMVGLVGYPMPSLLSTAHGYAFFLCLIPVCCSVLWMICMTVIKYGHRTTLREHPMKVEELVVKS